MPDGYGECGCRMVEIEGYGLVPTCEASHIWEKIRREQREHRDQD